MGIDVTDKLMVGASYGELEEFFDKIIELGETKDHYALDGALEVIECYFEYMSPYYDSDKEDWFIGYAVQNHREPRQEWYRDVLELCTKFEALTGVKPRIKGGAHVY